MNNDENKSEALFERLKGGSVFSFLKPAADPMAGPPLPRPEPLVSPQSAGQRDSQDLKKRLAELEAKIKRLETDAAKPSSVPVQNEARELIHGIDRRLAELETRLPAAPEQALSAPDLEERVKRLVGNYEAEIRAALGEYRRAGEEKSDKIEELAKELGEAMGHDRQTNADGAAELGRRLNEFKAEFGGTLEQLAGALERTLKEGENAVKSLLAEERGRREAAAAEAAGRLEKLERESSGGRAETASVLDDLSRRVEKNSSGLGETLKGLESMRERGELFENTLKEGGKELKSLLAEERGRREAAAAEAAGRLEKLEQGALAFKAAIDKAGSDMRMLKKEVLESAAKALDEGQERLEALAGRVQGEVMSAAGDKFSSLKVIWEAARVEIRNAQKTAYCAMEKCEKLDKALFFLDAKTGAFERKYSRGIAEAPKPDDNGEERREGAF